MNSIENILSKIGFDFRKCIDVKGKISVAEYFPVSAKRTGLYIYKLSDHTYYIGKTTNVVNRFSQHRKTHNNIEEFWFRPLRANKLDEEERTSIEIAELEGMLLLNKTFVTNTIGKCDLDDILSPDDQEYWLNNYKQPISELKLYNSVSESSVIRYRNNFQKLSIFPDYNILRNFLRKYIGLCIPSYAETEQSFWALSCLSSTNASTYPRYFCLSIYGMEVLVAGIEKTTKIPFIFFVTSQAFAENPERSLLDYKSKYPGLEFEYRGYQNAGADQITFLFRDFSVAEEILKDKKVVKSIKQLNLRLMRKGGTRYAPYHCFDLVKNVLST